MRNKSLLVLLVAALFVSGCGEPQNPIDVLRQSLNDEPNYSLVLEDMRQEGSMFPKFYHRYEVVNDWRSYSTDWLQVPENLYNRYLPYLGMVVWLRSAEGGEEEEWFEPPGYAYMGKKKYGKWKKHASGKKYWQFNPEYGHLRRYQKSPVYQGDYQLYHQAHLKHQPYFGAKRQYGTGGSYTKQMFPSYFSRKAVAASSAKTGRSSSMRSRSTGRGK